MKCRITYDTAGGNGTIIAEENEIDDIVATLENSGCFNIAVEQMHEFNPCETSACNKYHSCAECPYSKED